MLKALVMGLYTSLAALFYQSSSPMSMVVTLLLLAVTSCASLSVMGLFWFSYIMFLVLVGGVLILFGYASSLAPNPKFVFSGWSLGVVVGCGALMMGVSVLLEVSETSSGGALPMGGFVYVEGVELVAVFMISYLLLMLVAVVKVSSSMGGSLRGFK